MKKILVIEDDPKHLQDAKNFFSGIEDIEVTYHESFEPFTSIARYKGRSPSGDLRNYDGVISDIYFPHKPGQEIQPIGVSIMFLCKMMNIPCVHCTSGYHHGQHYQWINDLYINLRMDAGWEKIPKLIDCASGSEKLKVSPNEFDLVATKGWAEAWEELQKQFSLKTPV